MAQATNPRGPLILIVDDDENVLEIATEFVQRPGYNAVVVSNGADALNSLRRNQDVTVLFSDINMPGMDGEELARAAVAARPGLRVILTSGARRRTPNPLTLGVAGIQAQTRRVIEDRTFLGTVGRARWE